VRALERLILENEEELVAAIYKDLHRPKDFEVSSCLKSIRGFLREIEKLTADLKVDSPKATDNSFVRLSPL